MKELAVDSCLCGEDASVPETHTLHRRPIYDSARSRGGTRPLRGASDNAPLSALAFAEVGPRRFPLSIRFVNRCALTSHVSEDGGLLNAEMVQRRRAPLLTKASAQRRAVSEPRRGEFRPSSDPSLEGSGGGAHKLSAPAAGGYVS